MIKKTQRLGLLLPSSNTTQEPEFISVLPENVSLHCARLSLSNIDKNSTIAIVNELEAEAKKLLDAQADAIVLSATAPSTRKGKGYDQELCDRIRNATGKPAMTAATAMLQAFQTLNVKSIVLGAPWTDATNEFVGNFIEENGVSVLSRTAMGHVSNLEVGNLDSQTAYDLGKAISRADADAIFLACGNWLTMDVVEKLEADTGKVVLTTNGCAIWAVLKMLGGHRRIDGFGRLLRDHL